MQTNRCAEAEGGGSVAPGFEIRYIKAVCGSRSEFGSGRISIILPDPDRDRHPRPTDQCGAGIGFRSVSLSTKKYFCPENSI